MGDVPFDYWRPKMGLETTCFKFTGSQGALILIRPRYRFYSIE